MGLLPDQWEQFWESCTPLQQRILNALKSGRTVEDIAQESNLKVRQVTGEWAQMYLNAQNLRQGTDDR